MYNVNCKRIYNNFLFIHFMLTQIHKQKLLLTINFFDSSCSLVKYLPKQFLDSVNLIFSQAIQALCPSYTCSFLSSHKLWFSCAYATLHALAINNFVPQIRDLVFLLNQYQFKAIRAAKLL